MKHIVYINNYLSERIMNIRNNENTFSQAANNKIIGIKKSLEVNNCKVTILSSGLVNNSTGKFYKKYIDKDEPNIIYCSIIDLPLINTISSIISLFINVKKIYKVEKIDNIIFYNFKPEVAWTAFLCKKIFHIPITLEYEDGYTNVSELNKFKKLIFKFTENIVKCSIDSAILVTSKMQNKFTNIPTVVVRGIVNENIVNKRKNKNKNINIKNDNDIRIMFSGGLDEERGIRIILESLKYTKSNFKLIISGKGPLESLVKSNKDKRIKYLGYIDYNTMIDYMINAHILINAQISKSEFGMASFPSKIFEYVSSGNLIISSDVSDVEEFSEESFFIYNNDNPKDLANKIEEAILNIYNEEKINKINKLCKDNLPLNIGKKILKKIL